MRKLLILLLCSPAFPANHAARSPLWFDMSKLQERKQVGSIGDFALQLSLTEGVGGIDEFAMAALVKKLNRVSYPVFIQWKPEDECLIVVSRDHLREDNIIITSRIEASDSWKVDYHLRRRGWVVLFPKIYAHYLSTETRLAIMHLSDKLRDKSVEKILRGFDTVEIK